MLFVLRVSAAVCVWLLLALLLLLLLNQCTTAAAAADGTVAAAYDFLSGAERLSHASDCSTHLLAALASRGSLPWEESIPSNASTYQRQ